MKLWKNIRKSIFFADAKAVLLSYKFNEQIVDMVIDHPFFFVLKDKETVYFAGNVNTL